MADAGGLKPPEGFPSCGFESRLAQLWGGGAFPPPDHSARSFGLGAAHGHRLLTSPRNPYSVAAFRELLHKTTRSERGGRQEGGPCRPRHQYL